MAALLAVCSSTVVAVYLTPTFIRYAGAVGVLAVGAAAVVARAHWTNRRIVPAAGLCILAIADGGLVDPTETVTVWHPVAALAAYVLLGRALLWVVARYRLVRGSDVIVEGVLVGAAAAVAVQVLLDWWTRSQAVAPTSLGPVLAAVPGLLVGLDVALLVIVGRSVPAGALRRTPILVALFATLAATTGHVLAAAAVAGGEAPGAAAKAAISVALVAVGLGTIHAALVHRPPELPHEVPPFSPGHAGIVGVSVLAAPALVCIQVLWDLSVSGAVACGAGLIGVMLATHVVDLMRERASSEHLATHDALTQLPNRMLFVDRLERAIAHAARNGSPVGVLYIDLDRFKDVNDTLGHVGGDHLLRQAAKRLVACARDEDTVARLAGDEFAVLLPHLAGADDVVVVAERMLAALGDPVVIGDHAIRYGASVGIAVYPDDGVTAAELVNAADAAMYSAKEQGGAGIALFGAERHHDAMTRLELETALRRAIGADELILHYQPIVDAATGRTDGAEALVRWHHPERGLIPPGEFIPMAEQSDLIIDLGDWVIREACTELGRWQQLGCGDRFITVNVSPRHFRDDLVSSVTAALRSTGADPSRLVIELTENAAVEDVTLVAERLRELSELGVSAAIDDFGTGYCGLKYLVDLPVAALKLDQSFVQAMTPSSVAVVTATIAMARSLGLTLVAEGVETAEQRCFLERNGCDRMQGYHLGRPMPADDFVDRLRAEDRADRLPAGVPAWHGESAAEPAEGGVAAAQPVDAAAGWR